MNDTLAVRIVETIAEERGVEPTALEYSIQEYIETDALRLLANSRTDSWTLSFECPDGRVTVTGNGDVHLDPSDLAEAAPYQATVD